MEQGLFITFDLFKAQTETAFSFCSDSMLPYYLLCYSGSSLSAFYFSFPWLR